MFTEENFGQDFKEVLGFTHADLSYTRLHPDLIGSRNYIYDIISKTVYNAIISDEDDTDIQHTLKYALYIEAYRRHAPTSNLAHTNDGRRMLSDERYKTPFEWMLDKDDENLQIRADESISTLLQALEEKQYWKESDIYNEFTSIHVNTIEKFSAVYPIQSRLLFLRLRPYLKECETRHINSRLEKPLEDYDNKDLLSEIITEACVFYAISKGATRLRATLFREGFQIEETNHGKSKRAPSNNAPEQLAQLYMQDSLKSLRELEMHVGTNDTEEIKFTFNTNSKFVDS
ncbi:MAG TPA: DUF6712 family protein [Flavobacteriaceae bacterium]|nr:DUF6712 family protein [Flavobacteriaceae bacterium]